MNKDTQRVVFFDLETTGLQWWPSIGQLALPGQPQELIQPAEISQLGFAAYDLKTREQVDQFEIKVRIDEKKAKPEALALQGYDRNIWAMEAVEAFHASGRVKAFLDEHATEKRKAKSGSDFWVCQLGGHNAAAFDLPFLRSWMEGQHRFFPASYFVKDTMLLADLARTELGAKFNDLKLGTIAAALGIQADGPAHSALTDAKTAAAVYFTLVDILKKGARP